MRAYRLNLLQRLKRDTADQHASIEQAVPLLDPHLNLFLYADYLQHLLPFYRVVEDRLRSVCGLPEALPDLEDRWKSGLLESDMRALGRHRLEGATQKATAVAPRLQNLPQALGCLYVLEGSTLGGQILLKIVRGKLGKAAEGRTHFLESYGNETGPRWHYFCLAMERAVRGPDAEQEAILSAKVTFESFHAWLKHLTRSYTAAELAVR